MWHRVRDGTLSRVDFQTRMRPLRRQVKELLVFGGMCRQRKVAGMCREIPKMEKSMWVFADQEGVEPTNNTAERALRPAVLWRKGSFGSQSESGCRFAERILTAHTTCKLQKRSIVEYLTATCVAHFNGERAPSLLPQNTLLLKTA